MSAVTKTYFSTVPTSIAAFRLISVILLRAGPDCVTNLIFSTGLIRILQRVLACCDDEPALWQLADEIVGLLFEAVLAVAEDSDSGEDERIEDNELMETLQSCLRPAISEGRLRYQSHPPARRFDRIWSLYFHQGSPSYLRVVHRKRLVRYAIPSELICAADITDRIGSFLSLSQLPKELHLCSDEDFPPCCQVERGPRAGLEKLPSNRKRERVD